MFELKQRLPIYKNCVEVCCGRGELIWHTFPPKGFEVLNDKDSDVIRLHKFVQSVTKEQIIDFENNFDWTIDEQTYKKLLLQTEIRSDFEFAYRYLYLLGASRRDRTVYNSTFDKMKQGKKLKCIDRIRKVKHRLKNVVFTCMDAIEVIKKYDTPETFFFIDPPYPYRKRYYKVHDLDWQHLYDTLKNIKGTWMMVFDPTKPTKNHTDANAKVAEKIIDQNKHVCLKQKSKMTTMYQSAELAKDKSYFLVWSYEEPDLLVRGERAIEEINRLNMLRFKEVV